MANNDTRLFYLSGLFSIGFFLVIIFSTLTYVYHKDRVLKIKTKKSSIQISLIDTPKKTIKVKPQVIPIKKIVTPKPKKIDIPKKPQPQQKPQIEAPTTPSFGSLFSNVDTSKFKDKEIEIPKPRVSNEAINRLKGKIVKTELPVKQKDENLSEIVEADFKRTFSFKQQESIRVDYRELEIQSSSLDGSDQGTYDKFYSQVKSFLYNKWYPSETVAGNSAIVRFILNKNAILEHYKIVTRGKSSDFNSELIQYLESIKGKTISVDLRERVSFEVKFRAKE